jgi:putative tricarboxylic transport membrane protein
MFDVYMMVVFGVLGYLFKKLKYPLAPLVLALVLGDMAETAFRQSMLLSKGQMGIFWSNPLVGTIVTLALMLLVWPLVSRVIAALRTKPPSRAVGADVCLTVRATRSSAPCPLHCAAVPRRHARALAP